MNSRITMVNGTVKPDVDPGLSEWVWEALGQQMKMWMPVTL